MSGHGLGGLNSKIELKTFWPCYFFFIFYFLCNNASKTCVRNAFVKVAKTIETKSTNVNQSLSFVEKIRGDAKMNFRASS